MSLFRVLEAHSKELKFFSFLGSEREREREKVRERKKEREPERPSLRQSDSMSPKTPEAKNRERESNGSVR